MIRSIFTVVLALLYISVIHAQAPQPLQNSVSTQIVSSRALETAKFKIHSSDHSRNQAVNSSTANEHYCNSHNLTNKFLSKNGFEQEYLEFKEGVFEAAENYVAMKAQQ